MFSVELSGHERIILSEILGSALSDLRMEMGDPDRPEFRALVDQRKAVIQKMLGALERTRAVADPV